MCFLGIAGVDPEIGLTEANRQETTIKKAIIKASSTVVSLVISSKLNTRQPFNVCGIECLDIMVTDLNQNNTMLLTYREKGVHVY